MGVSFSHKRGMESLYGTTWINLKDIMLSEIRKAQKNQILLDLTCMWNLRKSNRSKSRLAAARGEGWREGRRGNRKD